MSNQKAKIGLVADEGGDLPKDLIERYKISIVPFKVDFGELAKFPGNIYQKIREAEKRGIKAFIKTSQPSPGDFLKAFKEKLKDFEKLICVTITSKHSGTYNSALQARNFLKEKEKIQVVDSLSGTGGEGLVILKAASLIEKGLKIEEILENLKKSISNTHLIFMLENPERLEASGRLPKILASWLKKLQKIGIRPLLGIKNGKIKPVGIKRGVRDIATALFKEFEKRISKIENKIVRVAITHADNEREAIKLKEMVEKIKNVKISFLNLIGNILGGIAGPGAISLSWQHD